MGGRNHIQPPCSALAPDTAPARLFFDQEHVDDTEDCIAIVPAEPIAPDLTKSNATRQLIADQLYSRYLNEG